jgi:hypothetical protein
MQPLSIKDTQLSSTVQRTLSVLLSNGISTAGKHSIAAAQIKAMHLSGAALRELVTAGIAAVTDVPGRRIVRPLTPVATEVEFFDNGDIDVTLALDLI